ncbi:hypothetical protein [Amycolatopsis sp.]|uniref:hypothetical protein n=1 Tax=Amycolatopsis sp. TaxID=37632 RepID=UPI002D7FDE16|nr:hypothetical protein [Amycolatopsis sp.]HET6706638.1 hypothetical protein [Amycolatopsis sp.]
MSAASALEDAYYIVIPRQAWFGQKSPAEVPERSEDVSETYYLPPLEPRPPLSLGAVTGIGGVSGSLVFGVVTGALATSPLGLAIGVAAGIFGGLMGSSLAEEIHDRRQ